MVAMTEDRTLDIKLPIAEWDDVERRMAIVARMTQAKMNLLRVT
jgi:hypothetical protein